MPKELDRRVLAIHGKSDLVQFYFCVTEKRRCWDSRSLPKRDRILIANDAYTDEERNFTRYLDAWRELERRLR